MKAYYSEEFRSAYNHKIKSTSVKEELSKEFQKQKEKLINDRKEIYPFEFYEERKENDLPANRIPKDGVLIMPYKYHTGNVISTSETISEEGFDVNKRMMKLIKEKFPQYEHIIETFRRPLGTTDATFNDFNQETKYSKPFDKERAERILKLVKLKLRAKPYLPVHFVDKLFAGLPLNTGTGYHNRKANNINVYANYMPGSDYLDKRNSKGYYFNAFHYYARTTVHKIKTYGHPFNENTTEEQLPN